MKRSAVSSRNGHKNGHHKNGASKSAVIAKATPAKLVKKSAGKTDKTAEKMTVGKSAAVLISSKKATGFRLDSGLLLKIHDTMIKARVMEERLIRMYKQNQGYFWLGGPGEEAFQVPFGLQILKGQGLDYDFMHFHYRQGPTLLTMGLDPADAMRQMKNTSTDPFSGGRNFASHYAIKDWNVVPVTSTIETQYLTAIGGGIAHARHGGKGITIVTGGDAGTAEGDFASCLVWASRPMLPLPMLIVVTNNGYGISTAAGPQHGEKEIADRARAFQMPSKRINGNDVEESYFAIQEAMDYVRKERKPYFLEAMVSRLYGHSSASGANWQNELDPIVVFEEKLLKADLMKRAEMDQIRERYEAEMLETSRRVQEEPMPDPSTIYDHTYLGQKGRYW